MARSRSALDALPPARQRASEAYLCGTIFTGAENARRGRSGDRRAGPGTSPPDRGENARATETVAAGAGRAGSGPGPLRAGRRRGDPRGRGAGPRHPHGRACAARPPRPGPPRPERRQRPAPRARRRAGRKTRAGARRGRGRRRAATAAQSRSRLRGRAPPRGPGSGMSPPARPRTRRAASRAPTTSPEEMRRAGARTARPAVSRNPKVSNRPRPFLEKSYFPGFREIVITSILNLEGNVRPLQGRKKDVESGPAPGNVASGFGPVPGVHPLVPSREHARDTCSLKR